MGRLGRRRRVAGSIRILIADDHASQRSGIRAILENDGDFEVCADVGDADSSVEDALRLKPDLCLLDVHMPGNGISAARRISEALPDTTIVMLTVSRNDEDLFDALRAGAIGYLMKDTSAERLPEALRGVLKGEAALPRSLVMKVIDEFQERGRRRASSALPKTARLTSREWEVLDLLCDGLNTNQIASRLFVGAVTVRSHVSSILKKLHVNDRDEAVELFSTN